MADLLADITMKPRYKPRTQTAFVRSLKFLGGGRTPDSIPFFNIKSLTRLNDANPPIYVCAISLLDSGTPVDPSLIRETQLFRTLVDRLGLQPSSAAAGEARLTHKMSLVLLEVFTYMVIINRARIKEEEDRAAAREATAQTYEFEELTA